MISLQKNFLLFVVLLVLPSCTFFDSTPGIKKIQSFKQASKVLDTTDSKTLVLLDVDDTLIIPASRIFRPGVQEKNREWVNEMFISAFQRAKRADSFYMDLWLLKEVPYVIEPEIIQIIKSLQDRGIIVLALTTTGTGSSQLIPSIPKWRLSTLAQVGIDFGRSSLPDIVFHELPSDSNGNYPLLYHDMLLCNSVPKEIVLGAFLDHINWQPDKIIFFDNNLKYIKAVAEEVEKRKIPFYGYEYLGAEKFSKDLDKEIALIQINHLIDHEEWLTEEEAQKLIKREKSVK